jgi:pantetheine-phosphate adenylyltransferase
MRAMSDATHALLPGSFDPLTNGHLDLIRRARALFGTLTVAVAVHPSKPGLFDPDERVELIRASCADLDVQVVTLEGLLVAGARAHGATAIVRGVRSGTDLDYESAMAWTNHDLAPELETVFLLPAPAHAHVSSTLVRQIAGMGGDVSAFVPAPVAAALARRFGS